MDLDRFSYSLHREEQEQKNLICPYCGEWKWECTCMIDIEEDNNDDIYQFMPALQKKPNT